jgi:uncharacterized protein YbjQ (UPF0145 family)
VVFSFTQTTEEPDIAKMYGLDFERLSTFIKTSPLGIPHTLTTFGGIEIDDSLVQRVVGDFKQYTAGIAAQQDNQKKAAEEARAQKQTALAKMLITSGFNFDGYTITKYSGYISGDDAIQIPRGTQGIFSGATDVGAALMESLVKIRRNALAELKEAAWALGCNAVVGVDFDYLTLDPETSNGSWTAANQRTVYLPYVFGVTANGNAVIIEKNKAPGSAWGSAD